MGFPPRLDGKSAPLPSDRIEICPNCGREFQVYELERVDTKVSRTCPYCGFDFPIKKSFGETRKKGRKQK